MHPAHPLLAVTHPDPYPYYAALAREQPLYWDKTLGLWVASHPTAISAVMRHPAARVRPLTEPVPRGLCPGPAGELFSRFVRMNDSRLHTRIKTLLMAYLQAQSQQACTPQWPAITLLSAVQADRFLYAAPVHAQAAFLGLPDQLHADCAVQIQAYLTALPANANADLIAAGHTAALTLQDRLESHLLAAEASPALRQLRDDGARDGIPAALLAANLAGLLFQSCEAGAGLLGNALILAGRRSLDASTTPAAARTVIDHVVRHDPPLHNTRRFMGNAIEIQGQRIEAGQTVLLVLAAAAMIEPDNAWTFGAHGHACPGQTLARSHAADALLHLLHAGTDAHALASHFRYRPLLNARVPQFDFSKDHQP
ncbi:cytochrome [Achromobacter seleniivolatilans]|uniref:Cytochrome n=1 Tax=Achromobacter seleniivolatilans TaxID=3047478 RepID=A0ABY9LTC8_9BURK|nr:cytochrome [Achromobacter sp. R39]WMD17996.1 cytochrome [Achromobacter sp. R39]